MHHLNDVVEPDEPDDVFELIRPLGQGAFATVYLVRFSVQTLTEQAKMQPDNKHVAVKVLKPELDDEDDETNVLNIAKEIRILKQCKHPNVVSLLGAYKDDEYVYVPELFPTMSDDL